MRVSDYELSHLILRFEQEKDMNVMHCVQNLGALRDLIDARIELAHIKQSLNVAALREACHGTYNGGHRTEETISAFHHGMDTVCNVLESLLDKSSCLVAGHGQKADGEMGKLATGEHQ